jgi:hypothetical protein
MYKFKAGLFPSNYASVSPMLNLYFGQVTVFTRTGVFEKVTAELQWLCIMGLFDRTMAARCRLNLKKLPK